MPDKADWVKKALSILSGLLPVGERYADVLHLNPAVRNDVFIISIVAAALAGFGGYESARHLRKGVSLGWLGVVGFLASIFSVLALTNDFSFGLSPKGVAISLRICYIIVFFFIGLSVGAFLALARPKSELKHTAGNSKNR